MNEIETFQPVTVSDEELARLYPGCRTARQYVLKSEPMLRPCLQFAEYRRDMHCTTQWHQTAISRADILTVDRTTQTVLLGGCGNIY
jgi:hypothetical protein